MEYTKLCLKRLRLPGMQMFSVRWLKLEKVGRVVIEATWGEGSSYMLASRSMMLEHVVVNW
jgi:hypothetical protein